MAINPEISLGVRPPVIQPLQILNPLEQYAKVQSLRNLMQEQQSGQLGLQAQQLKLQQEQKGIQEEDALRQRLAQNPNLTDAELISTVGAVKAAALMKAKGERLQQFYKTEGDRYSLLGRIAGSATDKTTAADAIMRAVSSNAFHTDPQKNAEIGRQALDHLNTNGFNPAEFKQIQLQAMEAAQQHTAQLADMEEQRKATLAPLALAEARSKSLVEQLGAAAQTVPSTQAEWDVWRADLSPELQKRIPVTYSPVTREQVQMLGVKPAAPVAGRDVPLPAAVQAQKVEEATARANILQSPEKIAQDLQIKQRELALQSENNINKAMSGDGAKVYSIASSIQPGLAQLREAFTKDYNGTLRGILLGTNPDLAKLASNVADQVGRLRSGGAVNPSEEKRFKDQIASRSDLLFGNPDATLAALDRYIVEAKKVADGLKPSEAKKTPAAATPAPSGTSKVKVWNEKTGRFEER